MPCYNTSSVEFVFECLKHPYIRALTNITCPVAEHSISYANTEPYLAAIFALSGMIGILVFYIFFFTLYKPSRRLCSDV